MNGTRLVRLSVVGSLSALGWFLAASAGDPLVDAFEAPPLEARAQVWWHWNNGNISKEGITADLEAMAAAGLGGAHVFDVDCGTPQGPVRFNTPEWDAMLVHAHREARRLGLQLTLENASGFSASGGPWVKPEESMKFVVWSERPVTGPRHFAETLPPLPNEHGFCRDLSVFAVKKPADEERPLLEKGSSVAFRKTAADTVVADIALARSAHATSFAFTLKTPVIWTESLTVTLERQTADGEWTPVRKEDFPICIGGSVIRVPRPMTFDLAEARIWRATFVFRGWAKDRCEVASVDLGRFSRLRLLAQKTLQAPDYGNVGPEPRIPASRLTRKEDVVVLTPKLCGDRLDWEVPAGEWTILRFGEAASGLTGVVATEGGRGPDIDKFDRAALHRHMQAFVGRMVRLCGIDPKSNPQTRTGLVATLIDSYEVGGQNWGSGVREAFRRDHGFDILSSPYFPAFTGRIIGSNEETESFLEKFRMTCAELFRRNYSDAFADEAHALGLMAVQESYGEAPAPSFTFADKMDVAMTEFWLKPGVVRVPSVVTQVVAQARRNARRIVQAESFTSFPQDDDWRQPLSAYKAQGDRMYVAGVNRVVYHRFAHQPWTDVRRRPGMTMGAWGTHFERTQTYWPYVGDWVRYENRCQALLQAGEFVSADVLAEPAFTHRRYEDGSEAWFVASTSAAPHRVVFSLGSVPAALKGSVPELWDPETGRRVQASLWAAKDGVVSVTVDFDALDSVFVVLRPNGKGTSPTEKGGLRPLETGSVSVEGPWRVSFDKTMGGPGEVAFARLVSWTERPEEGIRHYSGTAVYRKKLAVPRLGAGERLVLDLGEVKELARVTANGRPLPVLWKSPFCVDVTDAAKSAAELDLAIEVVNLWPNRLIGDAALPQDKRFTYSVYTPYKPMDPLLPSGLLGPVRLVRVVSGF